MSDVVNNNAVPADGPLAVHLKAYWWGYLAALLIVNFLFGEFIESGIQSECQKAGASIDCTCLASTAAEGYAPFYLLMPFKSSEAKRTVGREAARYCTMTGRGG